jgi:chromosome segregation ATPase
MSYSISNVQSQFQTTPRRFGNGQVLNIDTGINITYDLRNADGSIDRITRGVAGQFFHSPELYRDYGRCVTISEQVDRGEASQTREDLKRYVSVQTKTRIKASDLEIMVSTQQQIINNYQQTINQLNNQVQGLLQSLQSITESSANLRAQQLALQQQIDTLRAELIAKEALVATIPGLQAQVATQKNQIATMSLMVKLAAQLLQR